MLEYIVIRHGKGLAIKREDFSAYVVNSESIPAPQILLVPEALEECVTVLVELLVGLGSLLYEQHVSPIINSGNPSRMVAYELKMHHKNCAERGLI